MMVFDFEGMKSKQKNLLESKPKSVIFAMNNKSKPIIFF